MAKKESETFTVKEVDGKWVVAIYKKGLTTERIFDSEEFARSYAKGQDLRIRTTAR